MFETMHDAVLFEPHNTMNFYTWGDEQCCLPKGATRATLKDDPVKRLLLRKGDVLIFEEQLGPDTGLAADADPARRHAVRLTGVVPEADSVPDQQTKNEINRKQVSATPITDSLTNQAIVEIEWAPEDALPFPFCISAVTDTEHDAQLWQDVSVALGNIVLADHGVTIPEQPIPEQPIPEQPIGTVPEEMLFRVPPVSGDRCHVECSAARATAFPATVAKRSAHDGRDRGDHGHR